MSIVPSSTLRKVFNFVDLEHYLEKNKIKTTNNKNSVFFETEANIYIDKKTILLTKSCLNWPRQKHTHCKEFRKLVKQYKARVSSC